MNEQIDDIKLLVAKYITNQATDQEIITVKEWINANPENEEYYIELYSLWQDTLSLGNENVIDTEKAYSVFMARTADAVNKTSVRPIFSLSRIAAAASVIIVFALGIYYFTHPDITQADITAKNEIVVPKGGIKKTILKDGTIVWLNAGSNLKYAEDFGNTSRTVYLDGEAYFDIAKSQRKIPFIVKTKGFTIRDIGTAFNVKSYSDDALFETVVFKGEVSVEGKLSGSSHNDQKVYLKPRQVLKINETSAAKLITPKQLGNFQPKTGRAMEVLDIDDAQTNSYGGWKDDLLVFDGKTFAEISKILERRYDVEITVRDKDLLDYEFSGSFEKVADIYRALNIVKQTTPIAYEIKGRSVTIWKTEK